MNLKITRDEMISVVQKLLDADGDEQDLDEALFNLIEQTGVPKISDMIFYPENDGVTAEEIVDAVLRIKPLRITGPL